MAKSTGIILTVGCITAANEVFFAPTKPGQSAWQNFNWRIIPATLGLALALDGLEKLSEPFAVGLAYLSLAAVLIVPFGNAGTPLDNVSRMFGATKS